MKGSFTFRILSMLAQATMEASVVLETILATPYGSSIRKFQATERSIRLNRVRNQTIGGHKDGYYSLLYKLKRDGLVEKRSRSGKVFLALTRKGAMKLVELKKRSESLYPIPAYDAQVSDRFTIVAFDIPEIERKKRSWLRAVLQRLGLRMVQQSLWMGKKKLPDDFIRDIANLRIIECVEIFEITKTGTLRHIA